MLVLDHIQHHRISLAAPYNMVPICPVCFHPACVSLCSQTQHRTQMGLSRELPHQHKALGSIHSTTKKEHTMPKESQYRQFFGLRYLLPQTCYSVIQPKSNITFLSFPLHQIAMIRKQIPFPTNSSSGFSLSSQSQHMHSCLESFSHIGN